MPDLNDYYADLLAIAHDEMGITVDLEDDRGIANSIVAYLGAWDREGTQAMIEVGEDGRARVGTSDGAYYSFGDLQPDPEPWWPTITEAIEELGRRGFYPHNKP